MPLPSPSSPLTPTQQKLVDSGRPLVQAVVAHYLGRFRRGDRDEMIAEASVGLIQAAQRYDGGVGASFETFARRRIHGAILDHLRRELPNLRAMAAGHRAIADYMVAPHESVDEFAPDERAAERMTEITGGLAATVFAAYTTEQARHAEDAYVERDTLQRARESLDEAVTELPERDQLLIRRRFYDDVELIALAEELGTPYRTLKRRVAAILNQLGKAMSRRGVEGAGGRTSG